FHKHQREKANRHKVRCRRYVESDLNFFVIKFRSNKGRTVKSRVKQYNINHRIQNHAEELLHMNTPLQSSDLLPQFWANYSRITLVNTVLPERVTLDLNLQFRNSDAEHNFADLVIAEVKQEKA